MSETTDPVFVLNQTNALNVTPYGKERKMLSQGNLWHKIIIHNVATLDREIVLKALLNAVHPLDLIPVNYKIEGNNAFFIARNCGAALEKLCRDNLVIQNTQGQPYILTVVLGFSNTTETQLNVQNNIYNTITKRFNSGVLDLDGFHKDSDLSELIFCILSQPKILYFVLHLCKPLAPRVLKLSNNELRILSPIEVMWSVKSLISLDLRNNLIENMVSLTALKSMNIKELWLDGNPVCQNYDDTGYIQAVKEVCPSIERLDGMLLGTKGFLAYRRNYVIAPNAVELVDQFLEHYFTLYDSKDRNRLDGLYHQNALFSLSSSYIPGQNTSLTARLEGYKKTSRNLLKLSDFSKTTEEIASGADEVLKKLCSLPATEHDPYTFTVDVVSYSSESVVLTITGAFRQPVTTLVDAECLYGFSRTFILVALENGEFNIINEMFHVTNASTSLAKRAFKIVRVTKPTPVILEKPQTPKELARMVAAVCKITTLNKDWAQRCLEESRWDLKKALEIFVEFYKGDKIPPDAFTSEFVQQATSNSAIPIPEGYDEAEWKKMSKRKRKKIRYQTRLKQTELPTSM